MSSYTSKSGGSSVATDCAFYDSDDEDSAFSTYNGDDFFDLTSVIRTSLDCMESDHKYNNQTMYDSNIRHNSLSQRAKNKTQVNMFSRDKFSRDDEEAMQDITNNGQLSQPKSKSIFRRLSEYSQKLVGNRSKTERSQRKSVEFVNTCTSQNKTTKIHERKFRFSDSDVSEINLMFDECCSMSYATTPTSSLGGVRSTRRVQVQECAPKLPSAPRPVLPPIRKQSDQAAKQAPNKPVGKPEITGIELNMKVKGSLNKDEHNELEDTNRRRSNILIKNTDKKDRLRQKFYTDQTRMSDLCTSASRQNQTVVDSTKSSIGRNNGPFRKTGFHLPMLQFKRKSDTIRRPQYNWLETLQSFGRE